MAFVHLQRELQQELSRHVLHDHLNQEMGCMEELYNIDRVVPQNLIYPVIVTPTNDGYAMQSVDFPEINESCNKNCPGISGTLTESLDAGGN